MTVKKILIAEDHPIIVLALKTILQELVPDVIIYQTNNCVEFLKIASEEHIKFCIVDLNLQDGFSFDAIDILLKLSPDTNILVYTSFPGDIYAKKLFKIGIHGFLNKKSSEETIKECLKRFLQEEFYISKEFLPLIFKHKHSNESQNPFDLLSTQELIVIEYLLEGIHTKSIAEKMNIMPNTVATYKKRAFQKLEIEHVVQLDKLYQQFKK